MNKEKIELICPNCSGTARYYRKKTKDYVCRRCGFSGKENEWEKEVWKRVE